MELDLIVRNRLQAVKGIDRPIATLLVTLMQEADLELARRASDPELRALVDRYLDPRGKLIPGPEVPISHSPELPGVVEGPEIE